MTIIITSIELSVFVINTSNIYNSVVINNNRNKFCFCMCVFVIVFVFVFVIVFVFVFVPVFFSGVVTKASAKGELTRIFNPVLIFRKYFAHLAVILFTFSFP